MKRYIFHKICLTVFIILNLSFTWPVKEPKITSSFGESRWDHFHDGVDFVSSSLPVNPVQNGKLVYLWDKSLFPTENYPGGGNYRVLEHEEYYTIYMHLKENPVFKYNYTPEDTMGEIGDTGHSSGSHLHISFLKKGAFESVNPLLVFPQIIDNRSPEIGDVYIRIDEKYFRIRDKENIRLTRHYPLLLDVYDAVSAGKAASKLGIFKIAADLNGQTVLNNTFSAILSGKNGLTIGGRSFQDLFDERGYYKVPDLKYNNGLNILNVRAEDLAGNIVTRKISFSVNLDIVQ